MPSAAGGRRRGRPTLERETIVDAALKLAQRPDVQAMSFRALGRELGADPTAVYRHVRDRNELVEACLDRLIGEVAGSIPTGLSWRERLRTAALAYFEVIVAHPVIGAEVDHCKRTYGAGAPLRGPVRDDAQLAPRSAVVGVGAPRPRRTSSLRLCTRSTRSRTRTRTV